MKEKKKIGKSFETNENTYRSSIQNYCMAIQRSAPMSQCGAANANVFFEVSGWTSPTWKPASGKFSKTSVSPGEEQPPFVLQIETTHIFHGSTISGTMTGR